MSRPRKPFGANHPGRLPATMIKVLAAEISDPRRLRRGKQYAKDGSVLDIIIEPGTVTCEVQGSRSTPYIASIDVSQGDGMPLRRDIQTHCNCPDDNNWDGFACKHVVAAMFTLSDELLLVPELLDVWRDHDPGPIDAEAETDTDADPDSVDGRPEDAEQRRHLSLVRATDSDTTRRGRSGPQRSGPPDDPLEGLLSIPDGARLPEIPLIEPVEPLAPKQRQLASVLRDALGHLRFDWD